MTKALVTGGAGFIGSHLVESLLRRGDSVRVLDNFSTGRRENLDDSHDSPFGSAPVPTDHQGKQGKLEVMEGDVCDQTRVKEAVRGMDWIFHLAAFVSVPKSVKDPKTCFAVNVAGTVGLLEAARQAGVQKVVLASSAAVYGVTDKLPITEDTPLRPLSPYAISKQVNELYGHFYTHTFGLPVIALRYLNVYGSRQRSDSDYAAVIPNFINRLLAEKAITIYGDGKQTRDFIYVADAVRANLLAAESDTAQGEAFNVCTGRETTLLDLLEELNKIVSHRSEGAPRGSPRGVQFEPPRLGDIYRSVGSPEKAMAVLGFHPETNLTDGLRQTVDWIRS